jgi:transcriptional regulator, abrB family
MKSTGIIRNIDTLGRIVIPMEMRNKLKISEKDPIEIHVEGNTISLKKYEPDCIFCGSSKNVVEYKGKNICEKCLAELKNMQ